MERVIEILRDLERGKFYGSVEVKLEAGKVVLVRKTETIKPGAENCRGNRGNEDERQR